MAEGGTLLLAAASGRGRVRRSVEGVGRTGGVVQLSSERCVSEVMLRRDEMTCRERRAIQLERRRLAEVQVRR